MLKDRVELRRGPRGPYLYSDNLFAGAPEFLVTPLHTGQVCLISQRRLEEPLQSVPVDLGTVQCHLNISLFTKAFSFYRWTLRYTLQFDKIHDSMFEDNSLTELIVATFF